MPNDCLDKKLVVSEIFKSIQGESTWAGLPCIFIRLAGCNLRCVWCDTTYAQSGGTSMTIRQILEECHRLSGQLVEITGGEPLLQEGCPALAECLLSRGMTVLCETNGSLPIVHLPPAVIRIVDFKCPGSGESARNDWSNVAALTPRDEVKFVISDRADYEWTREVIAKYDLVARCKQVLLSPAFGILEPSRVAQWILDDKLNARFQIQLQKIIWPPERRGV